MASVQKSYIHHVSGLVAKIRFGKWGTGLSKKDKVGLVIEIFVLVLNKNGDPTSTWCRFVAAAAADQTTQRL